jgi:hypothetical protein
MLEDGIYRVVRRVSDTPGPVKTMIMGAYNNHDMAARGLVFDSANFWWTIKHFKLLALGANLKTDDINTWVCNGFECKIVVTPNNAIEAFVFEDPGVISGQITNVAVWAFVQGKTKIAMGLLDQTAWAYPSYQVFYYGAETTTDFIFDWLHVDYPQNPGLVGGVGNSPTFWEHPRAWTWADLRPGTPLSLIGGVYLFPNSTVKAVKVIVDYIDSAGVAQQITLLPTKDVRGGTVFYTPPGTTDQIIRWYGPEYLGAVSNLDNHLGNIGYIKDNFPVNNYRIEGAIAWPHTGRCLLTSFQLHNYPSAEATIYSVGVTINPSTSGQWLFLKIGGQYYKESQNGQPGGFTKIWSLNPATNAPWDLAGVQSVESFGVASGWFDQVAGQHSLSFNDLHLDVNCANPVHSTINTQGDIYFHRDIYSEYGIWAIFFYDYPCMGLYNSGRPPWSTLLANVTRHESNFSNIPSRNSIIISAKISYGFRGMDARGGAYVRPFFYYDGIYHYGPAKVMGLNPWVRQDFDYTFYNPTYDQLQGGRFGLEIYNPDTYYNVTCFIEDLNAEISFQERGNIIEYKKQAVNEESIVFAQYAQNPIKPDDLYFTLSPGNFLPERSDLIYIQHGIPVWSGIVWTQKEKENHEVDIWGRARQILLFSRYIPNFFYHSRSTRWSGVYSLEKLFSDELPEYPYNQAAASRDDRFLTFEGGYIWHIGTPYTTLRETELGIFFLLNSALLQGAGETNGKMPGMAPLVQGRAMFSTNHDPTLGWQNDFTGSVHRLTKGTSANCADGEYFLSGDDLYVKPLPDSLIVLADHAVDTFIRPGDNDLGEYYLNVPHIFKGTPNICFDEFFESMGQELQFRPASGATVRMNAGIELSRGSATEPLRKFGHGINCLISEKPPTEPTATAIVGNGTIPQVSTDWKRARQYILNIITDGTRDGEDLRAYLALQRDEDDTLYSIDYNEEEPLLRVGDWVWAKPENKGFKAVRIRMNRVTHGHTQLTAGKRLFSASKKFGQWRNATGTTSQDHKIVSQAISMEGTGGVQAFTVSAADLVDDDWRCRLALNLEQRISSDPTLNTTTIKSVGRPPATLTVTGPYTGEGANTYDIEIVEGGYFTAWLTEIYYTYPTFRWRKNAGAWSGTTSLGSGWNEQGMWPLADGICIKVNWSAGSYYHPNSIATAAWQIAAINPARVKEYALTPKILRLKLNGRYIPPGRRLFINNSESVDIDISDYALSGNNSLEIGLQNGITLASSPNWYHTLKGSIDQYKRVKAVLND